MDSVKRSSCGFLSYFESERSFKSHIRSQFKKILPWFSHISRFSDFESRLRETKRSLNRWPVVTRSSIAYKGTMTDVLALLSRFYELTVSHIRYQSREICEINGTNLFKLWEYVYFAYFPPPMYDRKTTAWPFDTIHDILRSLSLAQSLLKGQTILTLGSHHRQVAVPRLVTSIVKVLDA